jgi:hypothetical protein
MYVCMYVWRVSLLLRLPPACLPASSVRLSLSLSLSLSLPVCRSQEMRKIKRYEGKIKACRSACTCAGTEVAECGKLEWGPTEMAETSDEMKRNDGSSGVNGIVRRVLERQ